MRSVSVVLPASMWAAMPMLRVCARSVLIAVVIASVSCRYCGHPGEGSPTVMGVGAVRLCHPFDILLLLDCPTTAGCCVEQFAGDPFHGGTFGTRVTGSHEPAQAQRL